MIRNPARAVTSVQARLRYADAVQTRLTALASLATAAAFALAAACGDDAPPAAPTPAPAPSAPTGDEAAAAPAEPERPERVRYDLAAHLSRAELRQGESLVVDFGVPGAHKYTLGGWRTRVARDPVREGEGPAAATASAITNVTGFVLVPSDAAGPRTLRLRARAVRDGRLTVYVDGETVGFASLPTDGAYATVSVTLPAERLRAGENTVQLRVPSTGPVPGVGSAGLLLDWLRLGPADDPHADEAPPAPEALAVREGSEAALAIPDGWSLGYAMEVWTEAHLRGSVRGSGSLEVVAVRDGAAPEVLSTVAGGEAGAPFDVDLARFAGEVVRLDLRARGAVRVVAPRVVTLDGGPLAPRRTIRNVVIYLTDTLRADKLRPYRPETRVRTPALDGWAERAAVFLGGHAQENWTKPSVATLLSGLFPWEHHATTEEAVVPSAVALLSERLRTDGFHTGAFIANGFCSDRFGFRQGWDTFRNYVREGERGQAEFVAADVLDWLDHRPESEPFFLYVHTIDPHVPYMPPREQLLLYDPEPYEGVVDFGRDRELLEGVKSGRIDLNTRDRARLEALYDGEITYHDLHFGSIVDGLARRGLADETMIVFTADHGEEFWDHGSVGHGHSVFEELVRVPLIVRIPGLTDGPVRLEDAVGLVDVAPTIYEALGRPIPEDLSGESLVPLLRGASPRAPRASVNGFMDGWRAIELGTLKLVHRTDRVVMLYDLGEDPRETTDVAASRPVAVRYLRGMLGLVLAGAERATHAAEVEAERVEIDETLRRQLEELGYAGASRAGVAD